MGKNFYLLTVTGVITGIPKGEKGELQSCVSQKKTPFASGIGRGKKKFSGVGEK